MNGFIQEGKARLLGVSSLERTKLAPEAPPIADILPGYDIDTWFGHSGWQGHAAGDRGKDQCGAYDRALHAQHPETLLRHRRRGRATTPEAFDAIIAAEGPRWQGARLVYISKQTPNAVNSSLTRKGASIEIMSMARGLTTGQVTHRQEPRWVHTA